jgi:hypothetical protein
MCDSPHQYEPTDAEAQELAQAISEWENEGGACLPLHEEEAQSEQCCD